MQIRKRVLCIKDVYSVVRKGGVYTVYEEEEMQEASYYYGDWTESKMGIITTVFRDLSIKVYLGLCEK